MIISITGKPCSGKGTVAKLFCSKYKFDYIGMGALFRELAIKHGFSSVTDFQNSADTKEVDKTIDDEIVKIDKTRKNENLVLDSRTAWHFAPSSFKVYIDVSLDEASKRLLNANREEEQAKTEEEAKQKLISRYKAENDRYKELYNIDCTNLNNFDCILDSTNKTPEELCKELYTAYEKFLSKSVKNIKTSNKNQ